MNKVDTRDLGSAHYTYEEYQDLHYQQKLALHFTLEVLV